MRTLFSNTIKCNHKQAHGFESEMVPDGVKYVGLQTHADIELEPEATV